MNKFGRILGVDYGTENIGLAMTDELGISVRPIGTFRPEEILEKLKDLLVKNNIRIIAVGNPTSYIDIINPIESVVRKFVKNLRKFLEKNRINVEIRMVDERGTTKNAKAMIRTFSRKKRENLYKKVDSFAACEIAERCAESELF